MHGRMRLRNVSFIAAPLLLGIYLPLVGCQQPNRQVPEPITETYFPPPPSPPRILYLGSLDDVPLTHKKPSRMAEFLFNPSPEPALAISKPIGVAAANGVLLVCDTQKGLVHTVDFKSGVVTKFGDSGAGRLIKPIDVAVDAQGQRYVADAARGEVVVYSSDGESLRALRPDPQVPFKPVAIDVGGKALFVVNGARQRVEALSPVTGALLRAFGDARNDPDRLRLPSGIVHDDGRIYVTDMMGARVVVFDTDGKYVTSFGRPGDRAGEFARPKHIAVGPDGVLFVVDAAFQRVQMFDRSHRVLMLFGAAGDKPGAMVLPAGICTDRSSLPYFANRIPAAFVADYLVFVTDQVGVSRVHVYAFGQRRLSIVAPSFNKPH